MKRYLVTAFLAAALAIPAVATAQHSRGADTPSVGTAVPASAPPSSPSPSPSQPATSSGTATSGTSTRTYDAGGGGEPAGAGRRRGDLPSTGTATLRGPAHGTGGGGGLPPHGGFYPWGFDDDGAIVDAYYGGYLGAYDPWYGWAPAYAPVAPSEYSGALKLKVTPADASVYVDGYYAGVVDDYDGIFQSLHLDAGPHHIEMRAPQHSALPVDVMIQPDLTITYRGALEKEP